MLLSRSTCCSSRRWSEAPASRSIIIIISTKADFFHPVPIIRFPFATVYPTDPSVCVPSSSWQEVKFGIVFFRESMRPTFLVCIFLLKYYDILSIQKFSYRVFVDRKLEVVWKTLTSSLLIDLGMQNNIVLCIPVSQKWIKTQFIFNRIADESFDCCRVTF